MSAAAATTPLSSPPSMPRAPATRCYLRIDVSEGGGATLTRCTVTRIASWYTSVEATNCLLQEVVSDSGSGVMLRSCTVFGTGVDACCAWLDIQDSIIWGSSPQGIVTRNPNMRPRVQNSCVRGDPVFPGPGNINQDPRFAALEIRLLPCSPAIDAASDDAPADDLDGNLRPCGGRPDMGAYEYCEADAGADCPPLPSFRRGDADGDGAHRISDAVAILWDLFTGVPAGNCRDALDVDDDGLVLISDPIALLGYLFLGGAAPPPPFVACGLDSTPDLVGCTSYPACP